jgi:hypothetical protein
MTDLVNAKPKHVSLKDLAAETGFYARGGDLRRALVSRGIETYQLKAAKNAPYFTSAESAEHFKSQLSDERASRGVPMRCPTQSQCGGVYLVEVPSYDGRTRFKIGWADSFHDRLSDYRTIIPDLRIIAVWHTADKWVERAAQKVARANGVAVTEELFEFDNPGSAISIIEDVMASMGIVLGHRTT